MNFDLKEIGLRLKKARNEINLTQREAAKLCGVLASTISEMETGTRRPHAKYLFFLASEFKINLNRIFTGEGMMFTDFEIKRDFGQDNELIKLLIHLLENSPDDRYKILRTISDIKRGLG